MLFGDRALFAVDYRPLGGDGDEAEIAFTYWVGGQRVGPVGLPATRGYLIEALRQILRDRGHRRSDALAALPSPDLLSRLRDPADALPQEGRWSAHFLDAPLDRSEYRDEFQTAMWAVYLIEDGARGRLIACERGAPECAFEVSVPAGFVDTVLFEAWTAARETPA